MPLELLYADDLILMAESEESLRDKIVKWKSGLEAKGLKMNTGKTKVMFSCSMKHKVEAVTARVRSAWKKYRECLPILTGKGFSLKLKGKVYASCVRSCLMHGSETWPMKVQHELKMNRTEMSMIRWMCAE